MIEKWKFHPEWLESHQVSTFGRVRTVDRHGAKGRNLKGKVCSLTLCSNGRVQICMNHKYRRIVCLVHRLVLETFVGPRPDGMEACHYDDVPTNNMLSNLRWDSRVANMADAKRNGSVFGTKGAGHHNTKLTKVDVFQITALLNSGELTQCGIGEEYKVCQTVISKIKLGKHWTQKEDASCPK